MTIFIQSTPAKTLRARFDSAMEYLNFSFYKLHSYSGYYATLPLLSHFCFFGKENKQRAHLLIFFKEARTPLGADFR